MSSRQYFYVVSGLPGLSMQQAHLPFTAKFFLGELKNKIDKEDFLLVRVLYYSRDNQNLLHILFNRDVAMQSEGYFSFQELKKGIEGNYLLPYFMMDFINLFRENKNRYSESVWETKLTEMYFREASATENTFLNQWMEFELNLKNLLLLLSSRSKTLPFGDFIIDATEIAKMMKENSAADFSLQPSVDFVNQAINIVETDNIMEREKKIDLLKWKKLGEMTFFNYFTIEAILNFLIKLMLLERWSMMVHDASGTGLAEMIEALTEKSLLVSAKQ